MYPSSPATRIDVLSSPMIMRKPALVSVRFKIWARSVKLEVLFPASTSLSSCFGTSMNTDLSGPTAFVFNPSDLNQIGDMALLKLKGETTWCSRCLSHKGYRFEYRNPTYRMQQQRIDSSRLLRTQYPYTYDLRWQSGRLMRKSTACLPNRRSFWIFSWEHQDLPREQWEDQALQLRQGNRRPIQVISGGLEISSGDLPWRLAWTSIPVPPACSPPGGPNSKPQLLGKWWLTAWSLTLRKDTMPFQSPLKKLTKSSPNPCLWNVASVYSYIDLQLMCR